MQQWQLDSHSGYRGLHGGTAYTTTPDPTPAVTYEINYLLLSARGEGSIHRVLLGSGEYLGNTLGDRAVDLVEGRPSGKRIS